MAVIRKVTPKKVEANIPKKQTVSRRPESDSGENAENIQLTKTQARQKRACFFCGSKNEPRYWDAASLKRFTNDRGKIVNRSRSGACAKHQRIITREIKRARYLSLLPYAVRV